MVILSAAKEPFFGASSRSFAALRMTAVLAITVWAVACGSAAKPDVVPAIKVVDQSTLDPAAQARADGGKPAYTRADVAFMSGMIHHHAQAVLIAKWAPSHGASESIRTLSERIVVSQRDEIMLMTSWLTERGEPAPVADTLGAATPHAGHTMPGMPTAAMMPGMLSTQQVARLDSARGRRFDRLFLQYMIQHHQGAIEMVKTLFGSPGAAHDGIVFRFATDVEADQNAEIDRMTKMLEAIPPAGAFPEII